MSYLMLRKSAHSLLILTLSSYFLSVINKQFYNLPFKEKQPTLFIKSLNLSKTGFQSLYRIPDNDHVRTKPVVKLILHSIRIYSFLVLFYISIKEKKRLSLIYQFIKSSFIVL